MLFITITNCSYIDNEIILKPARGDYEILETEILEVKLHSNFFLRKSILTFHILHRVKDRSQSIRSGIREFIYTDGGTAIVVRVNNFEDVVEKM